MGFAEPPVSVVIPAFQEERRIGQTLKVLLDYLGTVCPDSELIVVSDGSTDQTVNVARGFQKQSTTSLKIVELTKHTGKGAAVRAGVFEASKDYVLFTDADLAYSPLLLGQFVERLQEGSDLVIAQRAADATYRSYRRRLLQTAVRYLVSMLLIRGIGDTQAGLKGFRRDVALDLFGRQKIDGFLFDVEILLLAQRRGYRIDQIRVDCEDKPGSSIRLVRDSVKAFRDLMRIYWHTMWKE